MTTNPLLWWAEPAALLFEKTAEYYSKMAEVHENTPLAPVFAFGAMANATTAENITAIAEFKEQPLVPKYSVEAGGTVCRPAAWN